MPDLLLELFSEEIPARMQRRAAEDLRKLVTDALVGTGLVYEGAKAFATPRRLALTVHGLPARSPERREERKGPRVGAPQNAIDGFLKAAGLTSIDQAKVQQDKKGDFYVAESVKPGRPAEELIAEIVPKVMRGFPWPKSMRWGAASGKPGSLTWVRPLHSILCTFGPETEDPEIVRFDIDGIRSGDTTHGHRFMAPGEIVVRRFDDYVPKLEKAHVVLDADRRKNIILHGARDLALAHGLELVEDEGLLEEVAGLVEWPVVLAGSFDESFLEIPPEVIRTTIRVNQKCFVMRLPVSASFEASLREAPQDEEVGVRGAGTGGTRADGSPHPEVLAKRASKDEGGPQGTGNTGGSLAPRFILVANIEASDGGKAIVAGNERVIRARLADARHFWQTDKRDLPDLDTPAIREGAKRFALDLTKPLDQRMAKLAATEVVFHEKLGTQGDRVLRLANLAEWIIVRYASEQPAFGRAAVASDRVSRIVANVRRAARLAKADLVTEMVGEFPELQGLMGRYYAADQGENPSVTRAIQDHYRPLGPSDNVPSDPVTIAVALADKLDSLVGFWGVDERPTGSKDPYALRRAALGIIRLILSANAPFSLHAAFYAASLGQAQTYWENGTAAWWYDKEIEGEVIEGYVRYNDESARDQKAVIRQIADEGCTLLDRRTDSVIGERMGFPQLRDSLTEFFADRLQVLMREQGARHDLVDAVFALGDQDDLVLVVRRIDALTQFFESRDGSNLLISYRRAVRLLEDEEKKSGGMFNGPVDPNLLKEPEEKNLAEVLDTVVDEARRALQEQNFRMAMLLFAGLRAPVDAFFDKVLVNAPDPAVRANRLRLLNKIREATLAVADFSKVEG